MTKAATKQDTILTHSPAGNTPQETSEVTSDAIKTGCRFNERNQSTGRELDLPASRQCSKSHGGWRRMHSPKLHTNAVQTYWTARWFAAFAMLILFGTGCAAHAGDGNSSFSTCIQGVAKDILQQGCVAAGIQNKVDYVAAMVSTSAAHCMSPWEQITSPDNATILSSPAGLLASLVIALDSYNTPLLRNSLDFVPLNSLELIWQLQFQGLLGNSGTDPLLDAYIHESSIHPDISILGGLPDLGQLITSSAHDAFGDVFPSLWNSTLQYGGKVVSVPLDARVLLAWYREDILKQHNILSTPKTWQEFLQVANLVNGTDVNQDGVGDFAVCLPVKQFCHSSVWLEAIAAPYLQYEGSAQGAFMYDPTNATSHPELILTDNQVTEPYLILKELVSNYVSPQDFKDCELVQPRFSSSMECAITINWGEQFKRNEFPGSIFRAGGSVLVDQLPGSTKIWNRKAREFQECTPGLCKHAQMEQLMDGTTKLVNRAPFTGASSHSVTINPHAASHRQQLALDFLLYMSSAEVSWKVITNPSLSGMLPFRQAHMNVNGWLAAGYNATRTQAFLAATNTALQHPNLAIEMRALGSQLLRDAAEVILHPYLISRKDVLATQAALGGFFREMVDYYGAEQFWKTLYPPQNYPSKEAIQVFIIPEQQAPKPGQGSGQRTTSWWLYCGMGIIGGLVVVVAWLLKHYKDRRKNLFGHIKSPGFGKETTLLVTDIQDSTPLWEKMDPAVMDDALQEHHRCIRSLLQKHMGYESATEGDSFILAFHTAKDALLFAVEVQTALLKAAWPEELLTYPLCQPVYVHNASFEAIHRYPDSYRRSMSMEMVEGDGPSSKEGSGTLQQTLTDRLKSLVWSPGKVIPNWLGQSSQALQRCPSVFKDREQWTFGQACKTLWKICNADDPKRILVFRGLRVRMGLHSGIIQGSDQMNTNLADKRVNYLGPGLNTAKAISDAAQGGMILLSEAVYECLPMETISQAHIILQWGTHEIQVSSNYVHICLYQALDLHLNTRIGAMGDVRTASCLEHGVMGAPMGKLAVCFLYMVGLSSLRAWSTEVTAIAEDMAIQECFSLLMDHDGYKVEATTGLMLTSFSSPANAVLWALTCHHSMLQLDWPAELLDHPMCEEVAMASEASDGTMVHSFLYRGIRVKFGIDVGEAIASVHPITGRLCYRGRVMNRAARVANKAATSQVLCSTDVWQAVVQKYEDAASKMDFTSVGLYELKGLEGAMELWQARLKHPEHIVPHHPTTSFSSSSAYSFSKPPTTGARHQSTTMGLFSALPSVNSLKSLLHKKGWDKEVDGKQMKASMHMTRSGTRSILGRSTTAGSGLSRSTTANTVWNHSATSASPLSRPTSSASMWQGSMEMADVGLLMPDVPVPSVLQDAGDLLPGVGPKLHSSPDPAALDTDGHISPGAARVQRRKPSETQKSKVRRASVHLIVRLPSAPGHCPPSPSMQNFRQDYCAHADGQLTPPDTPTHHSHAAHNNDSRPSSHQRIPSRHLNPVPEVNAPLSEAVARHKDMHAPAAPAGIPAYYSRDGDAVPVHNNQRKLHALNYTLAVNSPGLECDSP